MIYDWFFIFNKVEFEALDLISKTYTVFLTGIGQKNILVTKGNYISMTVDGDMLSLDMNDKNPHEFNDKAIFIDEQNDVFYGVKVES